MPGTSLRIALTQLGITTRRVRVEDDPSNALRRRHRSFKFLWIKQVYAQAPEGAAERKPFADK